MNMILCLIFTSFFNSKISSSFYYKMDYCIWLLLTEKKKKIKKLTRLLALY